MYAVFLSRSGFRSSLATSSGTRSFFARRELKQRKSATDSMKMTREDGVRRQVRYTERFRFLLFVYESSLRRRQIRLRDRFSSAKPSRFVISLRCSVAELGMNLRHTVEAWMMNDAEERWAKLLGTACIEAPTVKNLMRSGLSLGRVDSPVISLSIITSFESRYRVCSRESCVTK